MSVHKITPVKLANTKFDLGPANFTRVIKLECPTLCGMKGSSSTVGPYPVIVLPHTVNFYLDDHKTYKQVLTIYNVYDFAVRFRVLSTNPDKYTVVEPEGSIKPNCSSHIVVKHNDVKPSNCNVTDKFRVQFLDYTTKKVIGKKDIYATLHSTSPPPDESDESSNDGRRSFKRQSSESRFYDKDSSRDLNFSAKPRSGPNAFIVIIGAVCIAALFMPNEGESSTFIPLHFPCHLKLVFAYVLGLVTMVIFQ